MNPELPELLDRLQPFREEALKRGIPSQDIEQWIATARPSGTLVTRGDGPVVGRFGGPLMLPADAPDPYYPLLAALDCAALPEEVTGLPLPPDGCLLLFGFPDGGGPGGSAGEAVYIPAGTPVEEREVRYAYVYGEEGDEFYDADDNDDLSIYEQYPQDELRLSADIALPYHFTTSLPQPPGDSDDTLPGHPRSWDLAEAWQDTAGSITVDGPLHIGGYASHECTETDPVIDAALDALDALKMQKPDEVDAASLPAPEDWVLLAQWDIGLTGREGATLHWVMPRQDLERRRFDRTYVSVFWNP